MLYCLLTRTETNIYSYAQRSKFSDFLPRERQTDRQTETDRHPDRQTDRDRETETERQRDRQTEEKRKLFIYEGNR